MLEHHIWKETVLSGWDNTPLVATFVGAAGAGSGILWLLLLNGYRSDIISGQQQRVREHVHHFRLPPHA